jgi:hypothetical protein
MKPLAAAARQAATKPMGAAEAEAAAVKVLEEIPAD